MIFVIVLIVRCVFGKAILKMSISGAVRAVRFAVDSDARAWFGGRGYIRFIKEVEKQNKVTKIH